MKVGDLVTLSSYGNKVSRTGWVAHGDYGVVKSFRQCGPMAANMYTIHWMQSSYDHRHSTKRSYDVRGMSWQWEKWFDRRDLKFLKKKKG